MKRWRRDWTPGTRVRLNERCPWPERVGLEGVIVDPSVFAGRYPADARSTEVIVKIEADPLTDPIVHGDSRWTCRIPPRALDFII